MQHKVSTLYGNGHELLCKIDDNQIPIDQDQLADIIQQQGIDTIEVSEFIQKLASTDEPLSFTTQANKGVIVDVYEVDYPNPGNELKETQELAKNLDETKDFITQYLYPQTEVEEVVVGLRKDFEHTKSLEQPDTYPQIPPAHKRSWLEYFNSIVK